LKKRDQAMHRQGVVIALAHVIKAHYIYLRLMYSVGRKS
jgi:hypothetical protein